MSKVDVLQNLPMRRDKGRSSTPHRIVPSHHCI